MTTTTNNTDRLAGLVSARLKVLELLLQLTQRQLDLVRAGEMSDLLKLLTAKQTVLVQLQQLERLLDPFRAEDPEVRAWRSAKDRQCCQQAAQRCDELLSRTMQLEKAGETDMLRRRDDTATALSGVQGAAAASAAYGYAPPPSPALAQLHCEG